MKPALSFLKSHLSKRSVCACACVVCVCVRKRERERKSERDGQTHTETEKKEIVRQNNKGIDFSGFTTDLYAANWDQNMSWFLLGHMGGKLVEHFKSLTVCYSDHLV